MMEKRTNGEMKKIGDYEVVRLLGSGGMSDVYEVVDPRLEARYALKLFTRTEEETEARERFLAEGRLLAKLNHPRIVRVVDCAVDTSSGRPYFVMDLVLNEQGEKQSLDEVAPGSADEEMVGRWYDDLRDGLAYIHGKGVVHRDLKLQNVLIGPDGHAVLTDFGISRIFDAKGDGTRVIDTVQTIVRMREGRSLVMGSIGYMAPELEMGVVATPASDWYALGVITYKLLTGTWCDARTDVREGLETYDPVWRRIIPRLLHANPDGRICLSYAVEKTTLREAAEARAEERWRVEKHRGHIARHVARWMSALAAVLAVAVAVLTVWGLNRPPAVGTRTAVVIKPVSLTFEDLFPIPAEAGAEEILDEQDNLKMPSRSQFEEARIDALVLTQPLLAAVHTGQLTPELLLTRLEEMRAKLVEDDAEVTPFDELGDAAYMQVGDDEVLAKLLDFAIERLREQCEQ